MGKEAGPTISVSTSGFYITGNSSDATSGVAKYCYNTSDTPGEYTDVPEITVGAYSVPQYHVQATGTYRCHVLDTAGNHNFDTTSQITFYTYHCNYCGQNTNSLTNHYRCPTHYAQMSCSGPGQCSVVMYKCDSKYYASSSSKTAIGTFYCSYCYQPFNSGVYGYASCLQGHRTYMGVFCCSNDLNLYFTGYFRDRQCQDGATTCKIGLGTSFMTL